LAHCGVVGPHRARVATRGTARSSPHLSRFTGRDVHEDIRDLDRNLNQMSRGNATNQDVNAIVRSVQDARASAHGNAAAAYDGMLEALANCD